MAFRQGVRCQAATAGCQPGGADCRHSRCRAPAWYGCRSLSRCCRLPLAHAAHADAPWPPLRRAAAQLLLRLKRCQLALEGTWVALGRCGECGLRAQGSGSGFRVLAPWRARGWGSQATGPCRGRAAAFRGAWRGEGRESSGGWGTRHVLLDSVTSIVDAGALRQAVGV